MDSMPYATQQISDLLSGVRHCIASQDRSSSSSADGRRNNGSSRIMTEVLSGGLQDQVRMNALQFLARDGDGPAKKRAQQVIEDIAFGGLKSTPRHTDPESEEEEAGDVDDRYDYLDDSYDYRFDNDDDNDTSGTNTGNYKNTH